MESSLPYVGMVVQQFAQVGLLIVSKKAMLSGMTTFSLTFYSSALGTLTLLPLCFLIKRSARPQLSFHFLGCCFLIGLIGFLVQIFGYAGTFYAPSSLISAMMNLISGFTFVFAVLFRLETVDCRSFSTLAKSIGTIVAISGALVATLYQGPPLLMIPSHSNLTLQPLTQSANVLLGGLLFGVDCVIASLLMIVQAFVLKKYPVELIIMLFYSCFVAIFSLAASLMVERDLSAFSLKPKTRLFAVLYGGFFGNVFQLTIGSWCVRKKGPLFAATFHPIGVVLGTAMGVIFLHDTFYLGSLVGSIVILIGFYSVMWGKAKEGKLVDYNGVNSLESGGETAPLLSAKDAN